MESRTLNCTKKTSSNGTHGARVLMESETNTKRYQEFIATLPKKTGWRPKEILCKYGGHWWQQPRLHGLFYAKEHFHARPNDILICSNPKTGTTWLKALAFAIVNRSRFNTTTHPLLKRLPHEFVPYIEVDFAFFPTIDVLQDEGNHLFGTHVPYSCLPESVTKSICKIVYIWRDPKDTFVSMWNFFQKEKSEDGRLVSIEKAFDMFCEGLSVYGPYLDHVLEYWKAYQENQERVLFLQYEEMRRNPMANVKRLAEFMGYGFTEDEEEKLVIEKLIDLCSFETLKNLEAHQGDKERQDRPAVFPNSAYFRNAKVGDWQNYLSLEMAARIDGLMEKKFKGTGLLQHNK